MNTTKRIIGDYNLDAYNTNGTAGNINMSGNVNVTGNLNVQGTTTTINSTELTVSDKIMTLNDGETGAGVTGNYSGIEVDRGSLPSAVIRWNDSTDRWEVSSDGSTFEGIATAEGVASFDLVTDLTPQLGGDLDVNDKAIVSVSSGDIRIIPDGSGRLVLDSVVDIKDQLSDPAPISGYNKLYSMNEQGGGGTGLYFTNTTDSDELASRTRALVYSLIF